MKKFFSRDGDDGCTGLLGKGRVPKFDPRIEAIGSIDETNAVIGFARAISKGEQTLRMLITIQRDLHKIMTEIAATPENASHFRFINSERVIWLEKQIEQLEQYVEMPDGFLVPGDTKISAVLAIARTTTRRAERRIVQLIYDNKLENREILRYLNRLSSLFFVLELFENSLAGINSPTIANED